MRRKTNRWLQLVSDCLVSLCHNNVKIILSYKMPYIKEEDTYSKGYWDDSDNKNPVLACRVTENEQDWVPIFVHEYCHFLQWCEEPQIWKQSNQVNAHVMNDVISNNPITLKQLDFCLNTTRDLELDCEVRTVKLFKEYKVPINMKEYIKKANAYIFFHNHMKTYRSWWPKSCAPYENKKIVDACPSRFITNYDKNPTSVQQLLDIYYPSKRNNNIKD